MTLEKLIRRRFRQLDRKGIPSITEAEVLGAMIAEHAEGNEDLLFDSIFQALDQAGYRQLKEAYELIYRRMKAEWRLNIKRERYRREHE